MSGRYPFSGTSPWFPVHIVLRKANTYNVHGKPSSFIDRVLPASITITPVEVIESGARSVRQGISAKIPLSGVSGVVNVGDVIIWEEGEYTVTQVVSSHDHAGIFHFVTVWATVKRGGDV